MRTRLADALRDTSPATARLVERPETKLTTVSTLWLTDWQIIDVLNRTPPHPQRFFAGLSTDGTVKYLTASPDDFSALSQADGLEADSAEVAVSVAQVFLDSTQDFVKASYRVDDVDEIHWLPKPTDVENRTRAKVQQEYADRIKPAAAKESGDGWTVTAWMVYDRRLDKHTVTITGAGAVSDQVVHAYEGLPVPESR